MSDEAQQAETNLGEQEAPKPALALPGHRLRLTREELHLSRDEVAHHLHLDVRVVEALESDNYSRLPSAAYVCGYLRSYARLLKLPENEIVQAYSKGQEINAAIVPDNVAIIPDKKRNPVVLKLLAFILILVLVAAGLMWLAERFKMFESRTSSVSTSLDLSGINQVDQSSEDAAQGIQRPKQVQQQIQQYNAQTDLPDNEKITEADGATVPAPVAPVSQATIPSDLPAHSGNSTESNLRMTFSEDSWVEVTDGDGQRQVYKLVSKGSELSVNGPAPYVVLLGNAEGVTVYYKDKEFDHKRYQRGQIAYFRLGTKQE